MKAFIDRIFKARKQKKETLNEEITTKVADQATEAIVEAIIEEVKKEVKSEPVEVFKKPGHYFDDCNCFKCVRWRNQNAK